MIEKPRKVKLLQLTPECIVNFLFNWHKSKVIKFPYFLDIPEDAEIVGIKYSFLTNSFKILIKSEQFEEIPYFAEPSTIQSWTIDVKLPDSVQEEIRKAIKEADELRFVKTPGKEKN